MKYKFSFGFFAAIFCAAVLLISCADKLACSSYEVVLPELSRHWEETLGKPRWRLEWVNESGVWQEMESPGTEVLLNNEWSTPVLAWPFWPEKGLLPGMMRPCGALFPWDVSGESLVLSWKGGVDAVFWKEMSLAERSDEKSAGRLPWYFDWPRFRELLESDSIPENVRINPWLADWKFIAQRTFASGFDRRRIVSGTFSELTIPGLNGRWIGSSPFAPSMEAETGDSLTFSVWDTPDTWVSDGAVLKCSRSGWVFREF